MKKIFVLLAIFLILCGITVFAQVKPDGKKAWEHVNYLAAAEFKGRLSCTAEYQKAADYVAQKMKEYGLKPGGENGSYFQQVEFKRWQHFAPPARLEITSPQHVVFFPGKGRDFSPNSGTGSGIAKGQLVFVGYGLVTKKRKWNDYADLDVKGKIVLIIPGAPKFMEKISGKEKSLKTKIITALKKEAAGIIFMNIGDGIKGRQYLAGAAKGTCPEGFILITAEEQVLDKFFYQAGLSWRTLVSRTIREKQSLTTPLEVSVEIEAHYIDEKRKAPNVIGILPGKHPELKDEYIIIGGHLDHLGVGLDGVVYNGADDDASGVAVVLETARVLGQNHFRPDRSIVFTAWAGEELGLIGSRYYNKHPLFPLDKTVVYMNMDMVGTGDKDLYVGGMWEFSDFYDLLKENMQENFKEKLKFRIDYRGSDHSAFLPKGVTCISLRSGNVLTRELDDEHPEYHRPGDTPATIKPELLQQAAEYHYDNIVFLANCKENLLDPKHHINFIHKDSNVIDMHCDTIGRFLRGQDLSKDNPKGHIDIPKLKQGAVDLQVFACYVGPPGNDEQKNQAAKKAFDQIDAVLQLVEENQDDLILVKSPEDMRKLRGNRKTGVLIGIEGGYAIESDLRLLRSFYRNGVRLMTLTHWLHTDWADASGDPEPVFHGLTDFGEEVVKEMNKLGMIIDVSHIHDESFWDVIKITDSPVVASHSCCRALSDHHRNMSNKMLKALAKNGGVIGINYFPGFLTAENNKKQKKDRAPVNVQTVVDHIEHVIKITGSKNHVGLGSDFDGIFSTPEGLENTGKLANITAELFKRGYKDIDIKKILGGNFLRVFKKVCSKNT